MNGEFVDLRKKKKDKFHRYPYTSGVVSAKCKCLVYRMLHSCVEDSESKGLRIIVVREKRDAGVMNTGVAGGGAPSGPGHEQNEEDPPSYVEVERQRVYRRIERGGS